jgi:hypothetical protein
MLKATFGIARLLLAGALRGLTAAGSIVGIKYGWWALWWHDTRDFRLPALLLNAVFALAGGVISAWTYERLSERSRRQRWVRGTHMGAVLLLGQVDGAVRIITEELEASGVHVPSMETWEDVRKLRSLVASSPTAIRSERICSAIEHFVTRTWEFVRAIPVLQEDVVLFEQAAQAQGLDYNWPSILQNIDNGVFADHTADQAGAVVDVQLRAGFQLPWIVMRDARRYADSNLLRSAEAVAADRHHPEH